MILWLTTDLVDGHLRSIGNEANPCKIQNRTIYPFMLRSFTKTKREINGEIAPKNSFFLASHSCNLLKFDSTWNVNKYKFVLGLISMIIIIISLVLGLAANYPDQANKLVSLSPVCFKFLHNTFGLLGYGIGILSLCLGYYTNWFIYYTGSESRLVATILTVFMSTYPLHGAFMSGYRQVKALVSWWRN